MALTKEERNDVAGLLHEMARLANEAAQAVRQEGNPLTPTARLIVEAQEKGTEAVKLLIGDIID
jgi:hypothetical protein